MKLFKYMIVPLLMGVFFYTNSNARGPKGIRKKQPIGRIVAIEGTLKRETTRVGEWVLIVEYGKYGGVYALNSEIKTKVYTGKNIKLRGEIGESYYRPEYGYYYHDNIKKRTIFNIDHSSRTIKRYSRGNLSYREVEGTLIFTDNRVDPWILDVGNSIYILSDLPSQFDEGEKIDVHGLITQSNLSARYAFPNHKIPYQTVIHKLKVKSAFRIRRFVKLKWKKSNTKVLHYNKYGQVSYSINLSNSSDGSLVDGYVYPKKDAAWTLSTNLDNAYEPNAMVFTYYHKSGKVGSVGFCQKYPPISTYGNLSLYIDSDDNYQVYDIHSPTDIFCAGQIH